jgi:hypothetical protein
MALLLMLLLLLPSAASALDTSPSSAGEAAAPTLAAATGSEGAPAGPGSLFSTSISAQPLTAAAINMVMPLPKPPVHRFFDRPNLIGLAVHTAIRSADAAQTCAFMGHGVKEEWLPMKSCPAIAAYSLSMVPAQLATSYLLHRKGYHRLERWTPYLWAAPSAAGIAFSMRAW